MSWIFTEFYNVIYTYWQNIYYFFFSVTSVCIAKIFPGTIRIKIIRVNMKGILSIHSMQNAIKTLLEREFTKCRYKFCSWWLTLQLFKIFTGKPFYAGWKSYPYYSHRYIIPSAKSILRHTKLVRLITKQ